MARVIVADVYVSSPKRVWHAHNWWPCPVAAVHRAQILNDLWRDVEEAHAALSCDGERGVGFYLEIVEDTGVNQEAVQWRAWIRGQLRPDHLHWEKASLEAIRNGKEVLP